MNLKEKSIDWTSYICQISRFLMMLIVIFGVSQWLLGDTFIAWTLAAALAVAIEYGASWSAEREQAKMLASIEKIERIIKR